MAIGKRYVIFLAVGLLTAVGCFIRGEVAAQEKPLLYLKGIPSRVSPGDEFTATLALDGVSGLYGFQIELSYDSRLLEALDGDPERGGTNVAGRLVFKKVSGNDVYGGAVDTIVTVSAGEIKYNAMNDTPFPVTSGTVALADIKFKVLKEGLAPVVFRRSDYPHQKVYVFYDDNGRIGTVEPDLGDVLVNCAKSGAADTFPPTIKVVSTNPAVINPGSADNEVNKTTVTYTLSENTYISAWIETWVENGAGKNVHTLAQSSFVSGVENDPVKSIVWGGTGATDSDDEYVMVIEGRDAAGNVSKARSGKITVDKTGPFMTLNRVESYAFSPNGDFVKDRFVARIEIDEAADVQAVVFNAGVRVIEIGAVEAGQKFDLVWDGKNNLGNVLSNMKVTIRITAVDGVGNPGQLDIKDIFLDTVAPVVTPVGPILYSFDTLPDIMARVVESGVSGGLDMVSAKVRIDQGSYFNAEFTAADEVGFSPFSPLGYGVRAAFVEVYDLAGNKGQANWSFEVVPQVDVEIMSVAPNPFNPEIGPIEFQIRNGWVKNVVISAEIHGPGGGSPFAYIVNTVIAAGGNGVVSWNGKNASGAPAAGGNYPVKIFVKDLAGNGLLELDEVIIVDRVAPSVHLVSMSPVPPDNFMRMADGQIYPSAITADFTVSDAVSQTCDVRVYVETSGGEVIRTLFVDKNVSRGADVSVSWDGLNAYGRLAESDLYKLVLEAVDGAGNTGVNAGNDSVIIFMDNAGPEITMVKPAGGEDTGALISEVRIFIKDGEYGAGVESSRTVIYLNGALVTGASTWDVNNQELAFSLSMTGNDSELSVTAEDRLGNVTGSVFQLNVDTKEPWKTEIVSPVAGADGKIYVGGVAQIAVDAQDAEGGTGIAAVEFFADSALVETASGTDIGLVTTIDWDTTGVSVTGDPVYPDGEYEIRAVAYDGMNNSNEDTALIIVDNTAPVVVAAEAGNGGYFSNAADALNQDVAITATVDEANAYECRMQVWDRNQALPDAALVYEDTVLVSDSAQTCSMKWAGENSSEDSVADGEYVYSFAAVDGAGNVSDVRTGMVWLDSVAPETITVVAPEQDELIDKTYRIIVIAEDTFSGVKVVTLKANLDGFANIAIDNEEMGFDEVAVNYIYDWATKYEDNGEEVKLNGVYLLTFMVYDRAGNHTYSTRKTRVLNDSVSIVNPMVQPDPFSPGSGGEFDETVLSFIVLKRDPIVTYSGSVDIGLLSAGGWSNPQKSFPISSDVTEIHYHFFSQPWDGSVTGGALEDGVYEYAIFIDPVPGQTVRETGTVVVDTTPPVFLSNGTDPDTFFSPNGDGKSDSVMFVVEATDMSEFTGVVEIQCGTATPGNDPYQGDEAVALAMSGVPSAMTAAWDGRVNGEVVADGGYPYRITLTDAAGNSSEVTGVVIKNNPPIITAAEGGAAFSPNGDNSQDTAVIPWETDKGGVFSFELFTDMCSDSGPGCAGQALESEVSWGGGATVFTWDGAEAGGVEGKYYIRISGYNLVQGPGQGDVWNNESADVWVEVILDVTPPVVSAFYPYEDEFTDLEPKIKITVLDALSGLRDDFYSATNITIDSVEHSTSISSIGEGVFRVWTQVSQPLTVGPHFLDAQVWDRAGNMGDMDAMRFVSIVPVGADFRYDGLDDKLWVTDTDVPTQPYGEAHVELIGAGLEISHDIAVPGKGTFESGIGLKGRLYDVSRKKTIIKAVVPYPLATSGNSFPAIFITGISNESMAGEVDPEHLFEYQALLGFKLEMVGGVEKLRVLNWTAESGKEPRITSSFLNSNRSKMPLTVTVTYEEGEFEYRVSDAEGTSGVWRGSAPVEYMAAGFFMFSLGEEAGDSVSGSVILQSLMTNIARPMIDNIAAYNTDNPASREIIFNQDSYEIAVTGTPWQKGLKAYLLNMDNPLLSQNTPAVIFGSSVTSGPIEMTEETEGSGNYTSGPRAISSLTDNSGYGARRHMPVLRTAGFTTLKWPLGIDEIYARPDAPLSLLTDAVHNLGISNMDGPPEYDYILPGDRYKITALARPGNWDIRVSLVNYETLASAGSVEDATVAGPFRMTKTAEGVYEYSDALENITDALGTDASAVGPVAEYGPRYHERSFSANALFVGDPLIREVVVENKARPGAADVIEGEIVRVVAYGHEGIPMICALHNPDGGSGGGIALVSGIVNMSPVAEEPGKYIAEIHLEQLIDSKGNKAARVTGIVVTPDVQPPAQPDFVRLSWNSLAAIERDHIVPGPPFDVVISDGTQLQPAAGDPVSASITWTKPSANEDGSELDDLAGYFVYRTHRDETGRPVYEKVTENLLSGNTYVDNYSYTSNVYSYILSAVDSAGNQSEPGLNIASLPVSSMLIEGASFANGPSSVPTGYIRTGEEYRISGSVKGNYDTLVYYIANRDTLETGEPFSQAIIEGPVSITPGGASGNEINIVAALPSLADIDGDTASRLIALIAANGQIDEYTTAAGALKGGVAPVREVHISNADRPEKSEIRIGETVEVTAVGNPGLRLVATLVNPDNIAGGIAASLNQDGISLTETPSGSGSYTGTAQVTSNQDAAGQSSAGIAALVSDTNALVDPHVPSGETLSLLEVPSLTGNISVSPEWIMPGWNFESTYSISNNSAELLSNVSISVSIALPDGRKVFTSSTQETVTPGGGAVAGNLSHPAVYLGADNYDVVLWMDINGYQVRIAASSIFIVEDVIAGTITPDMPSYISGETANIDISLANVSGYDLAQVNTSLQLIEGTGTVAASVAGPAITPFPANGSYNDTISITVPASLPEETVYTLSLAGDVNGNYDTVATRNIRALPERILAGGTLSPETIVSNQEPIFNYNILNRTLAMITDGIIEGIIVSQDYQPGDPVFASFTADISSLGIRESVIMSSTFSPVQADPGDYILELFFRRDPSSDSEKVFEMPVKIESCDL